MKIFAFVSGKGGTGKSTVASNLAHTLCEDGQKVLLFDADFGLSNAETILGIDVPTTLAHIVRDNRNLSDAVLTTRLGFDFIGGGSGADELVGLSRETLKTLFDQLVEIGAQYEYVLIDCGPGLGEAIFLAASCATEIVVVSTPDATGLTDAYATVRAISARYPDKPLALVVSRAANESHGERVAKSLKAIFGQFLSREIRFLGAVREDPSVGMALGQGKPVTISHVKSGASQDIYDIGYTMVGEGEGEGSDELSILDRIKQAFGKGDPDEFDEAA